MANQEHLAILKQGVECWNGWRREHYLDLDPDLREANLRRTDLSKADLCGANLSRANLDGVELDRNDLSHVNFSQASLRDASFSDAYLLNADLSGSDLSNAYFGFADLSFTNLSYANLRGADLGFAKINGATLQGADFTQVRLAQTVFTDVDLRGVRGLKTVEHAGPSSIGIDTLYNSRGQIAKVFLRNAGIPETFLTSIDTLIGAMKSIDYYTCFLSYSSQDQLFAQKLYASLQKSGVRCWFAPHDMKIGDKIRARIEEAIHLQDKLLLLLSEHALASAWAEDEVEAALEKEQLQQHEVLFPVRLDESVMQTTQAWATKLRRMRHIGDFTCWMDPQAYQRAFERLLRDLKQAKQKY